MAVTDIILISYISSAVVVFFALAGRVHSNGTSFHQSPGMRLLFFMAIGPFTVLYLVLYFTVMGFLYVGQFLEWWAAPRK